MKSIKKIVTLLIIFVLSATLNVHAEGESTGEITLTPSATEVNPGDEVTIILNSKCQTGIGGLDSILDWDNSKVEFTNQSEFQLSGIDDETGKFVFSVLYNGDATEAELAILKFTVSDTVNAGETIIIKFSEIELIDVNYNDITLADEEIVLTVAGDDQNSGEGEGTQTPGEGEGTQTPGEGEGTQTPGEGEGTQTPGEGEGTQTPGEGEGTQTPGEGEGTQTPGEGEGTQTPDKNEENTKPSDEEDKTIADKPINNAGIEQYALTLIFVTILVTVGLYIKCRSYSDIK